MQSSRKFTCWARLPGGEQRLIEVVAESNEGAVRAGFAAYPRASSVSCRPSVAGEERRHG